MVDDDADVLRTIRNILEHDGIACVTAESGSHALSCAIDGSIDLILVDLRLRDTTGTAIIEVLHARGLRVPFAVITGFGTVGSTVEAMRLGALDVIEKPFSASGLAARVRALLRSIAARTASDPGFVVPSTEQSSSAAARWARLVILGTRAENDPKTLTLWAREVGVSYTSLREACQLVGVNAHDARDFMRMLRAVLRRQRTATPFEESLTVSGSRKPCWHPRSQSLQVSLNRQSLLA